jgi:hypothetical protein
MRSKFGFVLLAAAIVAAPAFARNDSPAGQWDGVLERNGVRTPVTVQLAQKGGLWSGTIEVDGASSPADSVRVIGNSVHFELPGQGVFDGTVSGDSMTGAVSGSGRPGSFALTREEPTDLFPYSNPTESAGP